MKTNDIRFIDYQTGQKGQEKISTDRDWWVVYNGSKVQEPRITGPDTKSEVLCAYS